MLFLGIILSGVMPMITQEVRSGAQNRDGVEALYAAEAGAKRALAAILAESSDWNWLGIEKDFTNEVKKKYYVSFLAPTDPDIGKCKITECSTSAYKVPDNVSGATAGCYCVKSVGTVNGFSKTVYVATKIAKASMPEALQTMVFGNANIIMDSNAKINGSAGTNGYIQMSTGNKITGVATYNTTSSTSSVLTTVGTKNPIATTLAVPTFSVTYTAPAAPAAPTAPAAPSIFSSSPWPLTNTWNFNNKSNPLPAGIYTSFGGFTYGSSKIATQGGMTLYVANNGTFGMDNSTWEMGHNTIVYVKDGGVSLTSKSSLETQGNTTFYINKGLFINNKMDLGGNSVVYTGLGAQLEGSSTLSGVRQLYLAGGNLTIGNSSSVAAPNILYVSQGISLDSKASLELASGIVHAAGSSITIGSYSTIAGASSMYAQQGINLNSNGTLLLPGAATLYLANNSANNLAANLLITGSNSVLTLGTLGQASVFYCNGSTNNGGTINIYGPNSGTTKTKVYFTGNFDLNNFSVLNIAGNVEIYISGTMRLNNNVDIKIADNSNVTFKMGGYTEMNSNATITTGKNSALALLIDADAHFTNNTTINKAVVIATGDIYMDSSASITGAVISTGTTIRMTNNSQITTDKDTIALVWNNILSESSSGGSGGSSGTSGFEIISWRSD